MNNNQRFIFHAHAHAIGGFITRPVQHTLESAAPAVLSTTGGRSTNRASAFRLDDPATGNLILSYDSAETTIEGGKDSGFYVTSINCVLRGLNVEDTLKIDEIAARLVVRYDASLRKPVMDCSGSAVTGVSLGGRTINIACDQAMGRDASNFHKFRKERPDLPFGAGRVRYSLGRGDDLKFEGTECGFIDQPNFGRIYFFEWSAGPGIQRLTMLRLKLGSPVAGEVTAGDGEPNGSEYP